MLHGDAIMPLNLHNQRIRNPKAKVRILISETGSVLDAVCIYADDYRMADRAESVALDYVFEPARENGKAIPVTYDVNIHFSYQSNYNVTKDSFGNMVDFIGVSSSRSLQLHLVHPGVLDTPLEIIEKPNPVLVKNQDGELELGQALIEGYVDSDGNFRFLKVKRADSSYIAEAALENFKRLKFTPPRRDGQRVVCQILIPFITETGKSL